MPYRRRLRRDSAAMRSDEPRARLAAALSSNDWTDGEKTILRWQYRDLGGFWTAFMEAAMRADDANLEHLSRAFPSAIEAVRSWKFGDLGRRMTEAGLID